MRQFAVFCDSRLLTSCAYCGGSPESRDHVPSLVFIDDPPPDNLPVVDACNQCNQRFSLHEEYLSCFIEAVRVGSAVPIQQMRPKIQRILAARPRLAARLARSQASHLGELTWKPEIQRVENVVLKLARGHAAYELSQPQLDSPNRIEVIPLPAMSNEQYMEFNSTETVSNLPEIGSRAMQRMVESWPTCFAQWQVVQPRRYRYLVSTQTGVVVRFVIGDYLACEVSWR